MARVNAATHGGARLSHGGAGGGGSLTWLRGLGRGFFDPRPPFTRRRGCQEHFPAARGWTPPPGGSLELFWRCGLVLRGRNVACSYTNKLLKSDFEMRI